MTKFFAPADLPYFEAGSFRFGSLSSYRKIEESALAKAGQRFSDDQEGYTETHVQGYYFDSMGASIDGFEFSGNTALVAVRLRTEIVGHVFCASAGHYSTAAHNAFLLGENYDDGDFYHPTPTLTNFCVINIHKFIVGIGECINRIAFNGQYQNDGIYDPNSPQISVGLINYNKAPVVLSEEYSDEGGDFGRTSEELESDAVFRKPPHFRAEREVRVLLPRLAQFEGKSAVTLRSKLLRDSIISLGKL